MDKAPARLRFEKLLYSHLIPEFCDDERRCLDPASFKRDSFTVSEHDCLYFLRAWEAGLLVPQGRGLYRTANGLASEQFFWEGQKAIQPRPFTLWLEPIISVGGIARLHYDHGWPSNLIDCQSKDWAFDIVARQRSNGALGIAGEVKKSNAEIDKLISEMRNWGPVPDAAEPASGAARNAFRKVAALKRERPPLFWALGPNGRSEVFSLGYEGDTVVMNACDEARLAFANFSQD